MVLFFGIHPKHTYTNAFTSKNHYNAYHGIVRPKKLEIISVMAINYGTTTKWKDYSIQH